MVAVLTGITDLASGAAHNCAVADPDSSAWCWGSNQDGELGAETETIANPVAVEVTDLEPVVGVAAGFINHSCAWLADGTAFCWGAGNYGQCGDGRTTRINRSPVVVAESSDVASLDAGMQTTCAALDDGTVWCWGDNHYGQIGTGGSGGQVTSPTRVAGLENVDGVSTGGSHSCAWLDDGRVMCWGRGNYGQLGNGELSNSTSPVPVSGLRDVVWLDVGVDFTCALTIAGEVWCWGMNDSGELGDGTTTRRATPVHIPIPPEE